MTKKRFSPTKKFNKTNISKAPSDKPIVYKIKNSKGNNIYTGISKRGEGQNRLMDHLSSGKDPVKGGKTVQIKQFNTIKEARQEEKIIIKKEQPNQNVQDK